MSKREVRLHCRLRKPQISRGELLAFALDVLGRLRLEGELGIRICSSRSMAALNRRFRGKAGPTDVLSFPDGAPQPGGEVYLGDIVIAAPVAAAAAEEEGVPLEVELRRLLLHGILHLAGYDHEADSGAMRRRERALRKEWGIG
jgi:probable rRNA maturation factor